MPRPDVAVGKYEGREQVLAEVHESARRRAATLAGYVADDIADGREAYAPDVARFCWARDCERIAYAVWHMEVHDAFPAWWIRTAVAA